MNLTKIVSNSLKYPFRNIARLPIICILFILIAFVPIGMLSDNNSIMLIGVIAFFLFILIVPGYFLSIVKIGSNQSALMPSFNLVNNILDSIKVTVLRIVYMIVPAIMFFFSLTALGPTAREMIVNLKVLEFLATVGFGFILVLITYLIFEFFLFFAKARLAYFGSLSEALRIHKVIGDIKSIGIVNIIKWLIVMAILLNVITFATSFVMSIPYVGFLIYIGIVIPIIESIANYSLGLLYSNIAENY